MTAKKVPKTKLAATKVGRASRTLGQLWQVPVFFAGLLALVWVAASVLLRQDPAGPQFDADLNHLRRALEGKEKLDRAQQERAESLLGRMSQYPQKVGEVHFLTGSVYQRLAEGPAPNPDLKQNASHHLEKALDLGVTPADLPTLQFRLSRCLYDSGGDSRRIIDLLSRSLDQGTDHTVAALAMLVQAHLRLPAPNLDAALEANQKLLEAVPDREAQAEVLLTRGELLLRQEKREEAFKTLERISPKAPRAVKWKARLLQTRCCEEEGRWSKAIPLWQELLQDPAQVRGGKGRILYALGLCHHNSDQPDDKAAGEFWQQAQDQGGEEGLAAGLRLGELYLFGPNPDPAKALAIWTRALAKVSGAASYQNTLIDVGRARDLLENACRHFREAKDFARLQQAADLYKKIALPGVAEERVAQAHEGLARDLQTSAAAQPSVIPEATAEVQEKIRAELAQAAVFYEQAAEARSPGKRNEVLWRCARCYGAAKEPAKVISVLDRLVKEETAELRLAEAWLNKAEAYAALGQKDLANKAYIQCITYNHKTRFAYRARYLLALEQIDQKNLTQAENILKQNLEITDPAAVDAEAEEKTLYQLAALLYQRQDYDKAANYLKRAVEQFPKNPEVFRVRDQLGNCYREQARPWTEKWKKDITNTHFQGERNSCLERAASAYQKLADDLDTRAGQPALSPDEKALLRKARFAVADLKFELSEYPEAIRRYQDIWNQYRRELGGLIACLRLWQCFGVIVDPAEARRVREIVSTTVQQTLSDLATMDSSDEAFHGSAESWSKERWNERLMWIYQTLNPGTNPTPPAIPGN